MPGPRRRRVSETPIAPLHQVARPGSDGRMSLSSRGAIQAHKATPLAGTFVIGPLGVVEDVDEAACQLVGYSRDDLLGLHGSELIPPENRPATAASLDRMRRGELSFREAQLLRKDGSSIGVEVTSRLLADGRLGLSVRRRATA